MHSHQHHHQADVAGEIDPFLVQQGVHAPSFLQHQEDAPFQHNPHPHHPHHHPPPPHVHAHHDYAAPPTMRRGPRRAQGEGNVKGMEPVELDKTNILLIGPTG